MAKDNRTILRGIRVLKREQVPGKKRPRLTSVVFKDGMEDELAEHFSQERLDELTAQGSIAGEWKAIATEAPKLKPTGKPAVPA